jgi:hypothetical protein
MLHTPTPTSQSSGWDTDPSYAFHVHALIMPSGVNPSVAGLIVPATEGCSHDRSGPLTLLMLGTTRRTIVA